MSVEALADVLADASVGSDSLPLPFIPACPMGKGSAESTANKVIKDPVLPIEHCMLRSLGSHFCDVKHSETFVCGQYRTL